MTTNNVVGGMFLIKGSSSIAIVGKNGGMSLWDERESKTVAEAFVH